MAVTGHVSRGVLSVETPEAVAFRLELAGVGSRGLALAADTAAIGLIVAGELGATLIAMRLFGEVLGAFVWWIVAAFVALAFLTYWGYFIFGEVYRGGRTWGKRLLGLRVIKDDGAQVGFVDSAIRNIVRLADALPGWYAVGIVTMLLSPTGERLGDHAAGTLVVREPGGPDLERVPRPGPAPVRLAARYLHRAQDMPSEARMQAAPEVLSALGEDPAGLDLGEVERRIHGHVVGAGS